MEVNENEYLLHLISNAQPELFANKANHFKTRLETNLTFPPEQQWEIGLKEFGYVNNVDTVVNLPGGKEHSITIGKFYDNHALYEYLPHYLVEGGTQVKRHHIFNKTDTNKVNVNPIDCFLRYLQSDMNEVVWFRIIPVCFISVGMV